MSIQQAVHEHWGKYKPLTDLVPTASVYTGNVPRQDADGVLLSLPWVNLETQGDSETVRTSEGTQITTAQLEVNIFAEKYQDAKDISEVLLDHFDRAEFNWSRGRVLDMKQVGGLEVEEPDGTWHLLLQYQTRVTREAGA